MKNNTTNTEKTFTFTSYELSVMIRALIIHFNDTDKEVLSKKILDSAPWKSVMDLTTESRLEAIKELQNQGAFEEFISKFQDQTLARKN